jgi:DNA or RNA helicases of superfamily II
MILQLRPYQQAALTAIYEHLRRRDDNPCVVLPTGSGKTPLLAQICSDTVLQWHGRILVLSHVKELLEQAANHLASFLPVNMVGLHSAGLSRRDTVHPVIVAGIQTVANKAFDLGAFDLILVDEAHLIPESGEGRYLTFLRDAKVANPNVRVIGLTATPFRLGTGVLCKPENILNHVCYEANVKELILDGWLCPLRTKRGLECANLDNVRISSTGDFATDEMQAAFESVIKPACTEILQLCADRKSILIFAAGVEHARMVAEILGGEIVVGDTPKAERADMIRRFRAGEIRFLVNVGVLTTGFDAPNVDAVVLLRATMSAGLYCQMVGRGLRLHSSKPDCLILDYGDNALRHGPIDQIEVHDRSKKKKKAEEAPGKECPNCHEVIAAQYRICPNCEYEFPVNYASRHNSEAGDAPILSGEDTIIEEEVFGVRYHENVKRKPEGDSVTLRVEYVVDKLLGKSESEFLCFNHPLGSWARGNAEKWWRQRSRAPVPATVMDAVALAKADAVARTTGITLRFSPGKKYPEIIGHEYGDPPEWQDVAEDEDFFAADPVDELVDANDLPF